MTIDKIAELNAGGAKRMLELQEAKRVKGIYDRIAEQKRERDAHHFAKSSRIAPLSARKAELDAYRPRLASVRAEFEQRISDKQRERELAQTAMDEANSLARAAAEANGMDIAQAGIARTKAAQLRQQADELERLAATVEATHNHARDLSIDHDHAVTRFHDLQRLALQEIEAARRQDAEHAAQLDSVNSELAACHKVLEDYRAFEREYRAAEAAYSKVHYLIASESEEKRGADERAERDRQQAELQRRLGLGTR